MLATAWAQCEKAQVELRRAEASAAGAGDLEVSVALLLDAMTQAETALTTRLEECRNALAMIEVIGLTLQECIREVCAEFLVWRAYQVLTAPSCRVPRARR